MTADRKLAKLIARLTDAQRARVAGMDAANARCWAYRFALENLAEGREARAARAAEGRILAEVEKAGGVAEPAAIRAAVAAPARVFNRAVRFLKFIGAVCIDEAGLLCR